MDDVADTDNDLFFVCGYDALAFGYYQYLVTGVSMEFIPYPGVEADHCHDKVPAHILAYYRLSADPPTSKQATGQWLRSNLLRFNYFHDETSVIVSFVGRYRWVATLTWVEVNQDPL
jgi:hypothetical protein